MLDLNRNIFFAHVPKTGGSSIEYAHGFSLSKDVIIRHQNARQMMAYVKENGLPKPELAFIVVRNVYDRLKSTYRHFRMTALEQSDKYRQDYTFKTYLETVARYFERDEVDCRAALVFLQEARTRVAADIRHIERLDWWIEGLECPIVYLRFENLASDYSHKLSPVTKVRALPRRNVTPRDVRTIPCEFDKESLALVQSIYAREIEQFDMRVPPADQKVWVEEFEWAGRSDWRSFIA